MRQGADGAGALTQRGKHLLDVNARRREQRVGHGCAVKLGNRGEQLLAALPLHAHLARERIAVRVQAGGSQADEHVALLHAFGVEHLRAVDNADGEAGQVIVVRVHHAGVLSHFPTHERATRLTASLADAGDDLGHMLLAQLADGDVVQEEQRLGAAGEDVVHAHGHQVDAHGAVLAGELGDLELRAHAVGARNQQRLFHILRRGDAEQPAEPADVAHDLRTVGGMHGLLDRVDRAGPFGDIDAGCCVGDFLVAHDCSFVSRDGHAVA